MKAIWRTREVPGPCRGITCKSFHRKKTILDWYKRIRRTPKNKIREGYPCRSDQTRTLWGWDSSYCQGSWPEIRLCLRIDSESHQSHFSQDLCLCSLLRSRQHPLFLICFYFCFSMWEEGLETAKMAFDCNSRTQKYLTSWSKVRTGRRIRWCYDEEGEVAHWYRRSEPLRGIDQSNPSYASYQPKLELRPAEGELQLFVWG